MEELILKIINYCMQNDEIEPLNPSEKIGEETYSLIAEAIMSNHNEYNDSDIEIYVNKFISTYGNVFNMVRNFLLIPADLVETMRKAVTVGYELYCVEMDSEWNVLKKSPLPVDYVYNNGDYRFPKPKMGRIYEFRIKNYNEDAVIYRREYDSEYEIKTRLEDYSKEELLEEKQLKEKSFRNIA